MCKSFSLLLFIATIIGLSAAQNAANQSNWQAPADAAARKNPLSDKPELAAGGKKLFMRNCSQCHGTGTSGTHNNAPVLASDKVLQDSDGALFWKITNGNTRTGMPSFSSLPDGQRWQLVLYIRTLRAQSPAPEHTPK
jgi:mono/diheme cytochrome c family protein